MWHGLKAVSDVQFDCFPMIFVTGVLQHSYTREREARPAGLNRTAVPRLHGHPGVWNGSSSSEKQLSHACSALLTSPK